jgi:hypothetical protein
MFLNPEAHSATLWLAFAYTVEPISGFHGAAAHTANLPLLAGTAVLKPAPRAQSQADSLPSKSSFQGKC